jgi:hypothetical protein
MFSGEESERTSNLLELDVSQRGVGNVADEDPPNFEDTLPFV